MDTTTDTRKEVLCLNLNNKEIHFMDTNEAQRETVAEGKRRRRTFTEEFKVKTVRAIVEEGRRVTDVAKELDIQYTHLLRWKRNYLEGRFSKNQDTRNNTHVIAQLQKELQETRRERDRFKKALSVFVGEQSAQ